MYQIYQVLPNDDINEIAKKFNTTVDNLIDINGLSYPVRLVPGNYIVVPKVESDYFETYVVKKGDNLYSIASRYGTDVATLELLNGLKKNEFIYPNQELLIPTSNVSIYMTTGDETLNDVANNFNVSIDEILSDNKQLYLAPDQIIVYKRPKNEWKLFFFIVI